MAKLIKVTNNDTLEKAMAVARRRLGIAGARQLQRLVVFFTHGIMLIHWSSCTFHYIAYLYSASDDEFANTWVAAQVLAVMCSRIDRSAASRGITPRRCLRDSDALPPLTMYRRTHRKPPFVPQDMGDSDDTTKYITALYWTICTLTTVGRVVFPLLLLHEAIFK